MSNSANNCAIAAALALVSTAAFASMASAQQRTCSEIRAAALDWLAKTSSTLYTKADVTRSFRECMATGYWQNVSKSGGEAAVKK